MHLAALLLALHAASIAYIAAGASPNCDEVGHLTAGLWIWKFGSFHLYRVNPPLVKLVAAVPAALGDPVTDWSQAADGPNVRNEWSVGMDFIRANGMDAFWYHTAGRLLCVPFAVVGGCYVFLWGRKLYGDRAGLLALAMWMVSPMVLAWGATFTPDAACASLGLAAAFHLHGWLTQGTWRAAFTAGCVLGIAELTKTTWIILFPLVGLAWAVLRWRRRSAAAPGQCVLVLGLGVYLINAAYGFEGSFQPLRDYVFVSRPLAGAEAVSAGNQGGNRFKDSWLGRIPVPLPMNYVRGIDLQKVDFEYGKPSYLLGEWSPRGWWWYYAAALLVKEPLGLLLLPLLAACVRLRSGPRVSIAELVLLAPAAAVFLLVSSQAGFTRYLRYLLPALPALFVWGAQLADSKARGLRVAAGGLFLWAALSSARVYPYCISYFNELTGGPAGGWRVLLDANVDWGQDLLRLRRWVDAHPEARPLYIAHMGFVTASDVGIDSQWPVRTSELQAEGGPRTPSPGWYAVSVHELHEEHGDFEWLLERDPVDRIGWSWSIYHLPEPPPAGAP